MEENRVTTDNGASIVLYTTDDGNTQLEVKLEDETVWLTQSQMAELFGEIEASFHATLRTFSRKESWMNPWYVQKMHIPRNMAVERDMFKLLK